MDISAAYKHCVISWGADCLPSLSSINVVVDPRTLAGSAASVSCQWDKDGNCNIFTITFQKGYFSALWKALSERLPEHEAQRIFDLVIFKTTIHELCHVAQTWTPEYRRTLKTRQGTQWHGDTFHHLMYKAGYPVSRCSMGDHDTYVEGSSVKWSRVMQLALPK